jgi:hypothetical protein
MLIARLLLAALAYVLVTAVLFGNPLQPIAFATFWSDRLGVPHWRVIALLCVAASALIFARPLKNTVTALLRPLVFVILAVLLPTAVVGLYADGIRHRAVLAFGADEVEEQSFFTSIREAPSSWCRRTWGQTSYRSTGSRGVGSSGFDRQIEPPSASHPQQPVARSS